MNIETDYIKYKCIQKIEKKLQNKKEEIVKIENELYEIEGKIDSLKERSKGYKICFFDKKNHSFDDECYRCEIEYSEVVDEFCSTCSDIGNIYLVKKEEDYG